MNSFYDVFFLSSHEQDTLFAHLFSANYKLSYSITLQRYRYKIYRIHRNVIILSPPTVPQICGSKNIQTKFPNPTHTTFIYYEWDFCFQDLLSLYASMIY